MERYNAFLVSVSFFCSSLTGCMNPDQFDGPFVAKCIVLLLWLNISIILHRLRDTEIHYFCDHFVQFGTYRSSCYRNKCTSIYTIYLFQVTVNYAHVWNIIKWSVPVQKIIFAVISFSVLLSTLTFLKLEQSQIFDLQRNDQVSQYLNHF